MIISAYCYKYYRGSLAVNLSESGYFPAGYTVCTDGEKRDFPGTPAGHDAAQNYYRQQQTRAETLDNLIDTE